MTTEQRRKSMQGNKSSGTNIEIMLGKALFAKGLRYRKNNRKVFGTPDFTFRNYKIAIFADGDFWHGKEWDIHKKRLGANAGYWFDKIERNLERDFKVNKKLKEDGWIVLRFWESDIKRNLTEIVDFIHQHYLFQKEIFKTRKLQKKSKAIKKYLEDKEESSESLKRKAILYTREFLNSKYVDEEISLKVAEELLNYGTAPKERKSDK